MIFFLFLFLVSFFEVKTPAQAVQLSDVVEFQILSANKQKNEIKLLFTSKNDFKIYEKKLHFKFVPQNGFPYETHYISKIPAKVYFDPFDKIKKKIFESGNEFTLNLETPLSLKKPDSIEISVQACSNQVCLLPSKLIVSTQSTSKSVEKISNPFASIQEKPVQIKQDDDTKQRVTQKSAPDAFIEPANHVNRLNVSLSISVQKALQEGSLLLFPLLFLAGLLMNLTPCIYPMIPITLSVMAQFASLAPNLSKKEKKRRNFIFLFIYVSGAIITYSLLGVFAGMTGNIFGSQRSGLLFNTVAGFILFALGLSMLGAFHFYFLQRLANKIPLVQKNPALAVATMGALSGLVSAPCTGPVLATLLVLIAQNKNPVSGFAYMFFFALGFGIPYIFIGFLHEKTLRLPKFPRIISFVKLFFAALMFALSFYFFKPFLQTFSIFHFLFLAPSLRGVCAVFFCVLFCLIFCAKRGLRGKWARIFAFLFTCVLSFWFTLWITSSFSRGTTGQTALKPFVQGSQIHWQTNFDEALSIAKDEKKPILIDVWAQWCAACLEMDSTLWNNSALISILNKKYITVRLDYTDAPSDVQKLVEQWNIAGLPAIVLFHSNELDKGSPSLLFQGMIPVSTLLNEVKK